MGRIFVGSWLALIVVAIGLYDEPGNRFVLVGVPPELITSFTVRP